MMAGQPSTVGPLKVHFNNPRWFANTNGQAVWLTGSHTWANFQEREIEGHTPDFDCEGYLDFPQRHGHNFIRLCLCRGLAGLKRAPQSPSPLRLITRQRIPVPC